MSPEAELLLQLVGIGLVLGASYALVSLGLTLVFGILRVINFAHGEFYRLGLPYLVSMLAATLAVGVLAYGLSVAVIARLTRQHETAMLIATLGLSYVLMEGTQLLVSAEPRMVPTPFQDEILMVGPTFFTQQQILTLLVSLLVTGATFLYMRHTTGGKLMQAVAQNRIGATVSGINIGAIYNWTFSIGCALAALGGATMGATTAIYPAIGQAVVIKVFIVLILGGMGSIPGAVAGGLLLGLIESLGGGLLSVEYKDAFGYLMLILMLLVRPQGLFGRPQR
jgi:branched-chain amino acid transport system permease protein